MTTTSEWVENKLMDPNTFKAEPNRVDFNFMFNAKENLNLWNEFQSTVLADMQAYQSSAAEVFRQNNDVGEAVVSLSIDIDPRMGVRFGDRNLAPRYVLEFRDVMTMALGDNLSAEVKEEAEVARGTGTTVGTLHASTEGALGQQNMKTLLEGATKLPVVLSLAQKWLDLTGKLYLGVMHPGLSSIPIVTVLDWRGDELRVQVEEHRNLPLLAIERTMRTKPNQILRSECGHYLKLTYRLNSRVTTRYFKMLGGFPEKVFPQSLPVFNLAELPA